MRTLGILGQDIHSVSFALIEGEKLLTEKTFPATPETYLSALHETLTSWSLSPRDTDRLLVVRGPGSFTASRISTLIANAIRFVHSIPIIAMGNPKRLSWKGLLSDVPWNQTATDWILPLYDRPPHITMK